MLGNPTVFDNLLSKLSAFQKNMTDYSVTLFGSDEFQALVTEMNEQQLQQGIKSDGTQITPAYAPATIRYKKKKGDPYDRVTLKDYGDFYAGFRLKQYPGKMEIISQDPKSEELQDKYTPEILGLTAQNIQNARVYLLPFLRTYSKTLLAS